MRFLFHQIRRVFLTFILPRLIDRRFDRWPRSQPVPTPWLGAQSCRLPDVLADQMDGFLKSLGSYAGALPATLT